MQRLLKRQQFEAALAGSTVARTAHFALHRCALDGTPGGTPGHPASGHPATGPGSVGPQALFAVRAPWIGALVPKRWARRAVTRNTIRRQIYAVAQDRASTLPEAAHVVRLRQTFDPRQFPSATSDALRRVVRAELQALFAGARP